jgi:hypothetical protein
LIKYNKKFQNNLDIGLINYKLFSGKYIIYSEKGKGKIYDALDDDLLFEGEIINGKRLNGKGKEYDKHNKLIFEGEYLDEEKWNGKAKKYNYENILVFEGEY